METTIDVDWIYAQLIQKIELYSSDCNRIQRRELARVAVLLGLVKDIQEFYKMFPPKPKITRYNHSVNANNRKASSKSYKKKKRKLWQIRLMQEEQRKKQKRAWALWRNQHDEEMQSQITRKKWGSVYRPARIK